MVLIPAAECDRPVTPYQLISYQLAGSLMEPAGQLWHKWFDFMETNW
jgi:hypothetical protein